MGEKNARRLLRRELRMMRGITLYLMIGLAAAESPFESVPLPRSVTQMEHRLGVNDNQMPGGKHTIDKSKQSLSSYDQQILANGPPPSGDGPDPVLSQSEGERGRSPPMQQQWSGQTYVQPAPGYAQQYGSPVKQGYQQPGAYTYPNQQYQGGYQQYPQQQPAYAQPYQGQQAYPREQQQQYPQQQQQYQQYPQQQQQQQQQYQPQGSQYYDYSQAQGRLGGANGMIASASAYNDDALQPQQQDGNTNGNANRKYGNLGWHPTLSRMLGVPKSDRAKGPRLHLQGRLAQMKAQAVPQATKFQPSVDPTASTVAASKLSRAQALLRKAVKAGLVLHGTQSSKTTAMGQSCEEDPNNLHCMLSAKAKAEAEAQNGQQGGKSRLGDHAKRKLAMDRVKGRQQEGQQGRQGAPPVHLVGNTGEPQGHRAFNFPSDMVNKPAPLPSLAEKKRPVASGMVVGIGLGLVAIIVGVGGSVMYLQSRKEQRRNEKQAMSGFSADD